MKNSTFKDWWEEIEVTTTREERCNDDIIPTNVDNLAKWMEEAWKQGQKNQYNGTRER